MGLASLDRGAAAPRMVSLPLPRASQSRPGPKVAAPCLPCGAWRGVPGGPSGRPCPGGCPNARHAVPLPWRAFLGSAPSMLSYLCCVAAGLAPGRPAWDRGARPGQPAGPKHRGLAMLAFGPLGCHTQDPDGRWRACVPGPFGPCCGGCLQAGAGLAAWGRARTGRSGRHVLPIGRPWHAWRRSGLGHRWVY